MRQTAENKYTPEDLKAMQAWSLERKIQVTQAKILQFAEHLQGNAYISFSGGKDSTALLDIARKCYPEMEAVFVDTGLEYPEVRKFALSHKNVTAIRPNMGFAEVLQRYGWCYPSKEVARTIKYYRKGSKWAMNRMSGLDKNGSPSELFKGRFAKWKKLADGPFKISDDCCDIMKIIPLAEYQSQAGKYPITGTLAAESDLRKKAWLANGCNSFEGRIVSKPMSFWTEQDVLRYLREYGIPYAPVYGEIAQDKNGQYRTTGEKRTGCAFCPIGCHLDRPNKFQRMQVTHPALWRYVMNELNLKELLDFVGAKYEADDATVIDYGQITMF